jgi:hypothetical protein
MHIISRHVDVLAPLSVAEANWPHFARWVLTGHEKLACNEFVCADAEASGSISFEPLMPDKTRVHFEMTPPDDQDQLPVDEIERRIMHDLVVFKDYVERGGVDAKHPTPEEKAALRREAEAHGRPPRDSMLAPEDAAFWRP